MPCWYFERKEIKNSPSFRDGIDSNTESRYRREGARFIIDAGTKMMLRYDTCATGVVYFHRFYMYHSFKDFYRYVTAACCLFLAGKVEETPKKCKDIIKAAQTLLSPASFLRFGEDPREEVMTMERILLKTIKFDLQVEHPYSFMLKYAKYFKSSSDKEKTQKMAQMAWTFINDSLCTTLSLQWEPEIIAVSLMYLASRLTKFEPSDWSSRNSSKSKWWEDFVEGMTLELMEDICHQVLDLYSKQSKKNVEIDSPPRTPSKQESPPPPPPPDRTPGKRSREVTPSEAENNYKSSKHEKESKGLSSIKPSYSSQGTASSTSGGAPIPVAQHISSVKTTSKASGYSSADNPPVGPITDFSAYNPYVSSQMYTSSFMSQEGSQNIQSILAGSTGPPPPSNYPPMDPHLVPPSMDLAGSSQYPAPPNAALNELPYPYPPSQTQYAPPHSYPASIATNAPLSTGPLPGFEPYPPNLAPSYPSYAPQSSVTSQVSSYPQPSIQAPPQPYGGYSYPPHNMPRGQHPSYLSPSGPYSSQPSPGGSQQNYGGGNQQGHRGYQNQGSGRERQSIPALTEIKLVGWPNGNQKQ